MARPKALQPPSYRHHKHSGQAVVTLNGQDFYLGEHGSDESKAEYERLVGEWLLNGRRLPKRQPEVLPITITEVLASFQDHADAYYIQPDGKKTPEHAHFTTLMGIVRRLYGRAPAIEFGPLALRNVQAAMIETGWSRQFINQQTMRLRRIFKWAAAAELVPAYVHNALEKVDGLRRGKTQAPDTKPVKPVSEALVEAIRPRKQDEAGPPGVSRQVWAMIELQRLTGMRPGEVILMRRSDLDVSGDVWLYRPHRHKGQAAGRERVIAIGPQAQDVVKPFFKPDLEAYLFSPADAQAERLERIRAERLAAYKAKHPRSRRGDRVQPSQEDRRKTRPKQKPKSRYTRESYRRAIARACDAAFPPPAELTEGPKDETDEQKTARLAGLAKWREEHTWHPHQLRHTAGTRFRRKYGLEAAKAALGHATVQATQIYAEVDFEAAVKIAREVG